jgi:hypothetical protein
MKIKLLFSVMFILFCLIVTADAQANKPLAITSVSVVDQKQLPEVIFNVDIAEITDNVYYGDFECFYSIPKSYSDAEIIYTVPGNKKDVLVRRVHYGEGSIIETGYRFDKEHQYVAIRHIGSTQPDMVARAYLVKNTKNPLELDIKEEEINTSPPGINTIIENTLISKI